MVVVVVVLVVVVVVVCLYLTCFFLFSPRLYVMATAYLHHMPRDKTQRSAFDVLVTNLIYRAHCEVEAHHTRYLAGPVSENELFVDV